jgi:Mlc titration factor MtfA (ptsG expression regulator)
MTREPTLLDPYGAQDPAEFFAVATETFFERGAEGSGSGTWLYEAATILQAGSARGE